MTNPHHIGTGPEPFDLPAGHGDPGSPSGLTSGPARYSSVADVSRRLRERERDRSRWQATPTSFGPVGRILLTVPVVLICLGLLVIGVLFSKAALVLLALSAGVLTWYVKDVWLRA